MNIMFIAAVLFAPVLIVHARAEVAEVRVVVQARAAPDKTPHRFSFVDLTDVGDQTHILSNTVTVKGLGAGVRAPIRIATQSGGSASYSINGGAFRTSQTTVKNGDKVRLRNRIRTAGGSASVKVAIGTLSDTWSIAGVAPGPIPGGGAGAGARACFNPISAVAGTRFTADTLQTSPSSTITALTDSVVMGQTMFSGNLVTEFRSTNSFINSDQSLLSSADSRSYFRVDNTNFRSFQYGSETTGTAPMQTPPATNINDPFVEISFDLDVGESHTTRFTSGNVPGPRIPVEITRTYLGREMVTVPAGTFEACKFATRTTTSAGTSSSSATNEQWFDVGSGFSLKVLFSTGGMIELVRGAINGTPIQ